MKSFVVVIMIVCMFPAVPANAKVGPEFGSELEVIINYNTGIYPDTGDKEGHRLFNLYSGIESNKESPVWSPDGQWIAFTDKQTGIWIVPSEGGEPVLVYEYYQFETEDRYFATGGFRSLCFTSDSKEITFVKNFYDEARGSTIAITQDDLGNSRGLFQNAVYNIESVNIYTGKHRILMEEAVSPQWSHDGRYLYYVNWDNRVRIEELNAENFWRPGILDTVTGEKWFLVDDEYFNSHRWGTFQGTFTADNNYIILSIEDKIYRIPLEGGEPELIIPDDGTSNREPRLSPNGEWLLFYNLNSNDISIKGNIYKDPDDPDAGMSSFSRSSVVKQCVYNMNTGKLYDLFPLSVAKETINGVWSGDGNKICYHLSDLEQFDYDYRLHITDFNPNALYEYTTVNSLDIDLTNKTTEYITSADKVEININGENLFATESFDNVTHFNERQRELASNVDVFQSYPVWSPDGSSIAFTDYNQGIWIVPAEGGVPVQVYYNLIEYENTKLFFRTWYSNLYFSPDGTELLFNILAFHPDSSSFGPSIEVDTEGNITGVNGSFEKMKTNIMSVDIATGEAQVVIENGQHFSLSPDGRYICYVTFDENETNQNGVPIIYDTVTGETRTLTGDTKNIYGQSTFSPDGSHIVIAIQNPGINGPQLYLFPFEGGEPKQLTHLDSEENIFNPKYSPDGKWILYTEGGSFFSIMDNMSLMAYNTETGESLPVFENTNIPHCLGDWSPEGDKICLSIDSSAWSMIGGRRELYITDFRYFGLDISVNVTVEAPLSFELIGNYPNPFNPSTTIMFSLPEADFTDLVIYNITGQKIREFVSQYMSPGVHSVVWDGCDQNGLPASSGIYFSRLKSGDYVASSRMMLVK